MRRLRARLLVLRRALLQRCDEGRRRLAAGAGVCTVSIAAALAWPLVGAQPHPLPADALARPYAIVTSTPAPTASAPVTPPPSAPPTPVPTCAIPVVRNQPSLPATSPIALAIPSLAVDALVESAGRDRRGNMQVPSRACDVAWYSLGSAPGAPGDAVFDGHLDWYGAAAAFADLSHIQPGEEIDVTLAHGARVRFAVHAIRTLPFQSRPPWLFATTGAPTLTLFTCAGSWEQRLGTYSQRLVVTAVLVSHS